MPSSSSALCAAFPSDALLAAIIDSSDDAIVSKNLQGIITSWNRGAERIFGYTAAEAVGQSMLMIIPPELQHEEAEILQRLERRERIEHYQTTRQRKDGERIEVSVTMSPIQDPAGVVIGASNVSRDITTQKRAMETACRLAAIVESSDDAIIGKTLEGIITSWNRGAERIFGYSAEEMIGKSVYQLFPPDRWNEEPRIIERLKRGERVDHYQTIRVRKNGEHFNVSLTISPILDGSGRVIGASKVARDTTNEMRAMEQLARANEELKRADRMKSEFIAVMSHELRTPLNSIIGFSSVLRQGRSGPVTENQLKQLNLIHASGLHLLNLINDVLDLSRIEAGRIDLDPEEFSAADVLQEACRTLEVQAAAKKLELRCAVERGAPVCTDRKRLLQVVLNLLSNAIKFTARGSVELRARHDGDQLVVSVTDTGIGIPKDRQGELFRPFSQVEGSARRRYEGTGLGLYLSKRLVELLGGSITLVSDAGRGSTFTFWIPVRLASTDAAARPAEAAFA